MFIPLFLNKPMRRCSLPLSSFSNSCKNVASAIYWSIESDLLFLQPHNVSGTVSLQQHVSQLGQWVEQTRHCLQPFHFSSHSGGPSFKASLYPLTKSGQAAKVSVGKSYLQVRFLCPFFYRGTVPKKDLFTWNETAFCKKAEFTTVKVRLKLFSKRLTLNKHALEIIKDLMQFISSSTMGPSIYPHLWTLWTISLDVLLHENVFLIDVVALVYSICNILLEIVFYNKKCLHIHSKMNAPKVELRNSAGTVV